MLRVKPAAVKTAVPTAAPAISEEDKIRARQVRQLFIQLYQQLQPTITDEYRNQGYIVKTAVNTAAPSINEEFRNQGETGTDSCQYNCTNSCTHNCRGVQKSGRDR